VPGSGNHRRGGIVSEELKARIAALRSNNPWQAIDLLAAEVERLAKENAELKRVPKPKKREVDSDG